MGKNIFHKNTMRYVLLLMPLLFISCASIKQVPVQSIQRDSVVVKEILRDTVIIKEIVPQFVDRYVEIPIIPQDTLSEISTSYAVSTAGITNNQLHHTIKNKENIPIKIQYKDKIITNIEYIEKEIPVEVIVEKRYIPTFFWYSLIFNVIVILIVGVKIWISIRK